MRELGFSGDCCGCGRATGAEEHLHLTTGTLGWKKNRKLSVAKYDSLEASCCCHSIPSMLSIPSNLFNSIRLVYD